jgi:hypothetical protein
VRSPFRKRTSARGFALIGLLALLIAGAMYVVVGQLDANSIAREREQVTARSLAEAKVALIGWSAARGSAGNPRPGELPCPDTSSPGTANYGNEAGTCSAGAIGRLPWKSLGIGELKDGYGETLWYAIDGSFRTRSTNNNPINSDTRASMQVYTPDGTALLTQTGAEAVAIVFAPGPIIGGQLRSTTTEQTTASNYLDFAGPPTIPTLRNNATTNGPFILGPVVDATGSPLVNDRLLVISAHDLMAVVEKRVAKEISTLLTSYFVANGYYPYPANHNDPSCLDVGPLGYLTSCSGDPSACRGRLPMDDLSSVPVWLFYNHWGQVIHYAASTNKLASIPTGCLPSATLTVDGNPVSGLIFTPGTPLGGIVRNAPGQSIQLSDYLEDAVNQDGWTGLPSANHYCTPGSAACVPVPSANSNDKLYVLP